MNKFISLVLIASLSAQTGFAQDSKRPPNGGNMNPNGTPGQPGSQNGPKTNTPVSYTILTLPTNKEALRWVVTRSLKTQKDIDDNKTEQLTGNPNVRCYS